MRVAIVTAAGRHHDAAGQRGQHRESHKSQQKFFHGITFSGFNPSVGGHKNDLPSALLTRFFETPETGGGVFINPTTT